MGSLHEAHTQSALERDQQLLQAKEVVETAGLVLMLLSKMR